MKALLLKQNQVNATDLHYLCVVRKTTWLLKCASVQESVFCVNTFCQVFLPVEMDHRQRQTALSFLNNISLDRKAAEVNGAQSQAEDGARFTLLTSAPVIRTQTASGEQQPSKEEECGGQTRSEVKTSLLDTESKKWTSLESFRGPIRVIIVN